ncbi:MAG: NUDIX domain-containing protein [Candidatus Parcubacteria bacterium]|nr:NUDIX domain-containing protein [Candidatus Paceibacterota bacterium]
MAVIQTSQKKIRQGSYCFIIDPQAKKIIVEDNGGIPGGGIESWETAIQACIREVAEETTIRLLSIPISFIFLKS